MKSFRFSLQRVLDWRTLQMRQEEEKLGGLQNKLAEIVHRENALMAAQVKSESALLGLEAIGGSDLRALAAFQLHMQSERVALKAARTQCEAQIVEQRKRLLKARRDYRVLEKLKERRLKTWSYLSDRETEETAAESYISRWARTESEGK
jgi:flagellar export protein FliJ